MRVTTKVLPQQHAPARPKQRDLVAWLESNWRSTFASFVAAMDGAVMKPTNRGVMFRTGLPIGYFNLTFVDDHVSDAPSIVDASREFFAGVPFCLVGSDSNKALEVACEAAGFVCVDTMPGMALAPIPEVVLEGAPLLERVTHETMPLYREVFCESFGVPRDLAERCFPPRYLDLENVDNVIAHVDGEPVAIATVFESTGVAGVYNVATLPAHRGKGYGECVTWSVIQRAQKRGCHSAVLQSSEMGFRVYQRMGFEVVRNYRVFGQETAAP